MSATALDQAKSLLGSLSRGELEQLRDHVAAMISFSGPASESSSPHVASGAGPAASDRAFPALLYGALGAALFEETGEMAAPFGVFLQRRQGKAYDALAGHILAVHAGWFPKATRSQSAALCRIYARCVLGQIKEAGKPLDWRHICYALEGFTACMNGCFPGYARRGAMSVLLSRAIEGRVPS